MKNVSTVYHKLPHFLSEHVFMVKNETQKVWSCSVDICGNMEIKTWKGVDSTPAPPPPPPPPSLNGVNQIYTEVTPWCCISKRNALTLIHSPQLRPFANMDNLKGDIEFSKKILTPLKITLTLHRFIKKFLKIFQAHGNYIASPKQTRVQFQANGRRSEVPQRRLVAIQRKVRDDLHDYLCNGQQVLLKLRCCFPDFLCETELN